MTAPGDFTRPSPGPPHSITNKNGTVTKPSPTLTDAIIALDLSIKAVQDSLRELIEEPFLQIGKIHGFNPRNIVRIFRHVGSPKAKVDVYLTTGTGYIPLEGSDAATFLAWWDHYSLDPKDLFNQELPQ